jgi:maleylacetoacetate isomerase
LLLHTFWRSSAAYRVRIALALKGLEVEQHAIKFARSEHRQADYLDINPQGLIPALEHNGEVLTQSLAIIEYLDEQFGGPNLVWGNAAQRARIRSIAQHIACDIHPLNNLRVLQYLRNALAQPEDAVNRWYAHWIASGFAGLETQLARSSQHSRYCVGDTVSLADVCLVPQVYNARRFSCDLTPYPIVTAISQHLESLPAFAAAKPEVQPDAEP